MALPREAVPPGCGDVLGKVHLIDHDVYVRHLSAADQVRRLVDEAPGLSDYETTIDGRLVRVCGVDLVEREGPFRPAVQVLADALARLDHLRSEDAPAACIARLEALVSETVERL